MNILLVVPRYSLDNNINYNYHFPLGLAYISSAIKKEFSNVDCINLNHIPGAISNILGKKLSEKKYDFVCTGHTGIGYFAVKSIFNAVKNHPSKPKTILGGAIITSEPELIFNSLNPDFGVLGEGEITIIDLLKSIENKKDLTNVKGIIYRNKDGKIILTEKREVIEDLDSLPFPDFEGLDFENQLNNQSCNGSFFGNHFDYPRIYPLLGSRSCPFQCTFCYHSLGKKYRARSTKDIIKEIRLAKEKYNINGVYVFDDLFSLDKKKIYDFCKKIKELFEDTRGGCRWFCQLSVKDVDEELLKILRDSGCEILGFGFESMSPIVLKSMKKPISPQQIDNALKLCFKNKIGVQANFIFGDIAETKETAYETLNYWKKNCKGQIGMDFIQPYPGCEIYYHSIRKGIIKDRLEFIKNLELSHFFNMTDKMSNSDINQLKRDIDLALTANRKTSIAYNVKHMHNDKYEVASTCPYCHKKNIYKNFHINKRFYFSSFMMCRNCNMRYVVSSLLRKFSSSYYPKLFPIMRAYVELRNTILKKNL